MALLPRIFIQRHEQGRICPLSPWLFILLIESLAIKSRTGYLKGTLTNNSEHKMSLHADDVVVAVSELLKSRGIKEYFD